MADVKSSKDLGNQILLNWLEQFQKLAPTIRGEPVTSLDGKRLVIQM